MITLPSRVVSPHSAFFSKGQIFALMAMAATFAHGQNRVEMDRAILDASALNFFSAAANSSQNVDAQSYQRPPMETFKGFQYATYYDGDRHVCLARGRLSLGKLRGDSMHRLPDYER